MDCSEKYQLFEDNFHAVLYIIEAVVLLIDKKIELGMDSSASSTFSQIHFSYKWKFCIIPKYVSFRAVTKDLPKKNMKVK